MARSFFGIEKLLRIFSTNSDTSYVDFLFGSAAPGGDTGEQDDAPLGSLYIRQNGASSTIYQKIGTANSTADWQENGSSTATVGLWRPETVRATTNEALTAGATDPTAWADNDGSIDGTDFTVGEYVIGDADGTPALFEVTVVGGANSITLAAAADPLAADDTFVSKSYLPDAPAGQEGTAIVNYNGSVIIKLADVDWNFADGINMASAYSSSGVNGSISAADTVNSAIQKLEGNQEDIQTSLGTAQGDVDFGTFTGDIIADNVSAKAGMQALETELVDTRDNVDDLITLSGEPENSTSHAAFTAPASLLLAASQTARQLFQRIGDLLAQLRGVQATGITTAAPVDTVPHASVKACKWLVEAFEQATPANRKAFEVYALTDGTNVTDTTYAKLKLGSNFDLSLSVDISGSDMRLVAASTSAGVTVTARRIEVVKSVL